MTRPCAFCETPLRDDLWCESCEEFDPPETISTLTLDDCLKLYPLRKGELGLTETVGDPMKRRSA